MKRSSLVQRVTVGLWDSNKYCHVTSHVHHCEALYNNKLELFQFLCRMM